MKVANWIWVRIQKYLFFLNSIVYFLLTFVLVKKVENYQDAETIIKASDYLGKRINPYENEFFLNGYILTIPARIYGTLFPAEIGARLYILVNLALIGLVIWHMCRNRGSDKIILVLLVVLMSSPTRAMIASVQHTGIILGCSYFALTLALSQEPQLEFLKITKTFATSILLLIPIELKPQLMLPLIAVLFFQKKFRKYMFLTFGITFFGHLLFSLKYRMPLDLYWAERLLSRSSETTSVGTRENSPWALVSSATASSHLWLRASFFLYIFMIFSLIFYSKRKFVHENIFILAFSIPLVLSYVHPYDLILPVLVLAQRFVIEPFSRGAVFMISFFLFPTLNFNWQSFLFSIGVILYLWLNSRIRSSRRISDISEIAGALLCYSLLNYLVPNLWLKVNIHFSILIIGSLLIVFRWQTKSFEENLKS